MMMVGTGFDKIADHREQRNHQQHDEMRIISGDVDDPARDDDGSAQIGKQPAKGVCRADRDQR